MAFHFELRTDRPALVNFLEGSIDLNEIRAMVDEVNAWLDGLDHRVYYINNLSDVHLSLGDLMLGVQLATRGPRPPLHHPRIIETLVVTADSMIVMAARSVNSYVFGNVKIKTFGTLDEAFVYIDAKVTSSISFE